MRHAYQYTFYEPKYNEGEVRMAKVNYGLSVY